MSIQYKDLQRIERLILEVGKRLDSSSSSSALSLADVTLLIVHGSSMHSAGDERHSGLEPRNQRHDVRSMIGSVPELVLPGGSSYRSL
jgi:hypothetical protein